MTELDHTHDWGYGPRHKAGTVVMCRDLECNAVRITTTNNINDLRELTPNELTELTITALEDIIVHQTMTVIHGAAHGPERTRSLGYGPPSPRDGA